MSQVKSLTIAQCEQDKSSSVWALNTSGQAVSQAKGIVNITIVEGNGRATVVRVPVTFIPIDLTTQATKNALMMSPDFRRLVSAKIITLISEEDADTMLKSPAAQEEQRRLLNIDTMHEVQEGQQSPEVRSVLAEAAGDIGGLAMNLAHTSDGDEEAVCANLRNNRENLSKGELQYIVNNSTFAKVKTLAAEYILK